VELADVLHSLAEHWEFVTGRLDRDGQDRLRRLVAIAAAERTGPDERTEAVLDIIDVVLPVLPDKHPLELAIGGKRSAPATLERKLSPTLAELRAIVGDLRGLEDIGGPAGPDPQPEAAEGVWTGVRDRLLAAPMVTAAEVGAAGPLIRLDDGGRTVLPAFQFGPDGRPYGVVLAVNEVLDAADDPWGAADWWLLPNSWLRAIPADLVGRVEDLTLLDTAEREVEIDA
jgi:hypothetical protein